MNSAIIHPNHEQGFSFLELITTMGLIVVTMGMAVFNLRSLNNPLENGANQLRGFLKQVRAEAISSTSAYVVRAASDIGIETLRGNSCTDSAPVPESRMALQLPNGARLSDTTWTVCYNSRGFPDGNVQIELEDIGGQQKTVEVMLGGAVRIL